MKTAFLTIGITIVTALIVWGVWLFVFNKPVPSTGSLGTEGGTLPIVFPTQNQQGQQGQVSTTTPIQPTLLPQDPEVIKAFLNQAQVSKPSSYQTVVASNYAIQVWVGEKSSGEALLKYATSTGWTLASLGGGVTTNGDVVSGGGVWSASGLVQAGVPQAIAQQLTKTLQQNPEIIKAFVDQNQNGNPTSFEETAVVSPYALQIWEDNISGGGALFKYASSTGWILVTFGGGVWNVSDLVQEGIPQNIAQQLLGNQ